jgi:glucose/arabinose dehydrogenase
MDRRGFLKDTAAGAGGVAAALLADRPATAVAASSQPGAGPSGSLNPLPRIEPSGVSASLVDFCRPPATSTTAPVALLNYLFHAGDGSGRLFVCDARGKMWAIDRDGAATLFLDVAAIRGAAFLPGGQMGLRSFAFHPDFARRGAGGYRRFYTATTEIVASRPPGGRLLAGSHPVHHDNVITEWQVDAATLSTVVTSSRREVLRVAQNGVDHCQDQILFAPGASSSRTLYIGVGDGGFSRNNSDPYIQAQNPLSPLGKILRIDPLRQADGRPYGIPAINPFLNRANYLPEIYALGLRHPQNLSFDPNGSGTLLITDIGQGQIEEVNLGRKGADYGWPLREGTFVTDRRDDAKLYDKPSPDRSSFTDPVAQYDHDEGTAAKVAAVTGGFVYRGTRIPRLVGHYVLGDIVTGRIFHVPVAQLVKGRQTPLKELTLLRAGAPVTLLGLLGKTRADLRFGQGGDGELYVLTKQDGAIRRLAA